MKTRISSFCDDYCSILDPVDEHLLEAIGCVEREGREDLLQIPLMQLADARHRFGSLIEKIEHQQAYLIIFGPLKAGKSTLMNAISGTYVSEVSSMPAYPCLVYASHGEETGFSAISYNGNRQEFGDNEGLQQILDESHSLLAERIRMHEQKGEEFDPRVHYTDAVRRIDVKVPVPALNEANTVLVDTPGLYSRMKFGYDLMTREFRDSAACAVFVVKSDNLFLEQVFDEFNQLLNIFSRIFLVVNMDTSKRDLRPDGSLGPSAESSDPQKIIDAFTSLSMSEPLREAYEDGRLMIYPIDLLSAASAEMTKNTSAADVPEQNAFAPEMPDVPEMAETSEEQAAEEVIDLEVVGEEVVENETDYEAEPAADVELDESSIGTFDAFLGDLTEYLNSSEYLLEFERDSLVQGRSICEDIRDKCDVSKANAFMEQQRDLEGMRDELTSLVSDIDEVSESDLEAWFEAVRSRCLDAAKTDALRQADELKKQMRQSVEHWMQNDESLQTLQHRCRGAVHKAYEPLSMLLPESLVASFDTPTGGVQVDEYVSERLQRIGIDLRAHAIPYVQELKHILKPEENAFDLITENIAVKKSIFDWVMFRSIGKVRERLFGTSECPKNPIPADKKKKRLTQQGLEDIQKAIDEFVSASFPDPQCSYIETHADSYISKFVKSLKSHLRTIRREKAGQLDAVNERIAGDQRVVEAFQRLDSNLAAIEQQMDSLAESIIPTPELEGIEFPEVSEPEALETEVVDQVAETENWETEEASSEDIAEEAPAEDEGSGFVTLMESEPSAEVRS